MDTTAEALRRSEILRELEPSALERLVRIARRDRVGAGRDLFTAGKPRDRFFLILNGHLDVRAPTGEGSESLVVLGPGDSASEAALLEPGVHPATGRAVTDVEYLELDASAVRGVLVDDAPAAMALFASIARIIARRLQYASARRAGWDLVYRAGETRTEHDLLGDREVPADARYGIQTLRAVENFPITGIRIAHFPELIRALAMVKQAAVRANGRLGLIDDRIGSAIGRANVRR